MKSAAKWLIAGGAFLLDASFLLPFVTVPSASASVSLLQIAGIPYFFLLYLFPAGALTALILALVPTYDDATRKNFLIGQILSLGLAMLLLLVTLAYFVFWSLAGRDPLGIAALFSAGCQNACEVWPGIGFYGLFSGFGLAILGLFGRHLPLFQGIRAFRTSQVMAPVPLPLQAQKTDMAVRSPRLEFQKGELVNQAIQVKGEVFTIGRGRDNDLQLFDPDRNISRVHAQLRFAQDAWFIQDQDSKLGTFVNGKRIKAARLFSGDEIMIGEHIFNFRE
jgi:hypothetical protein